MAKKAHRQQTQPLVTRRLRITSRIVVGFFQRRIVPHRFALADIALVLSAGTIAILAALHAATAAAYLTLVAIALLAASVTVWPRQAWVRRPAL